MNFELTKPGRSFKGAMAYYLHDKREEGAEERPATSDRVAWTETRNLATDGPHTATRIMIATADQAEELKRRAGVSTQGRKGTQPVYAFSLAWHPDEAQGLDRAEMTRAGDAALKVMGLDRHQAVLIAHRDTAHPHVHVVVNRVDPETGRMAQVGPTQARALNTWAGRYEREQGRIVSPNRAAREDRAAEARRRHPDPAARRAHIEEGRRRRAEAAQGRRKAVGRSSTPQAAQAAAQEALGAPQSPAVVLRDLGAVLGEKHKAEAAELRGRREAGAAVLRAEHRERRRAAVEQLRGERRESAKAQEAAPVPTGRLGRALAAAREQRREGPEAGRSLWGLAARNLVAPGRQEATLRVAQERRRRATGEALRERRAEVLRGLRGREAEDWRRHREGHRDARDALEERHGRERLELRREWGRLRDDRGRDKAGAEPERGRREAGARVDAGRSVERAPEREVAERPQSAEAREALGRLRAERDRPRENARDALARMRAAREAPARQSRDRDRNQDRER